MSVRVVARIRPLLKQEIQKDIIVTTDPSEPQPSRTVRIPNPKNDAELYTFQFNSVYGHNATQQDLFDGEVAPTVKHLYKGFDVTLFAYGVTGTGKTHTMRGGKSLTDRGVIPRLLSAVYRRARKIEKDSAGTTTVQVAMSYYEIYNDRVYDLFEPPEKRTTAGLPIRDNNGKSVVVGLTERPCSNLREFEHLYDQANVNRSTSATKLNAHSSRSHAILCVKLTQTSDDRTLISCASAIDLAGSEDNRRTENNKDRMVESASINKSLFVLAQCVEAISKKHSRIPYRESKMTRILSLGQNNGLTVMILNLAPVRSYHLDTLSSLNFANRTKKIEVNEVENEPIFKGPPAKPTMAFGGGFSRQPLRLLTSTQNVQPPQDTNKQRDKPIIKTFSVYPDKSRPLSQVSIGTKRSLPPSNVGSNRPSKVARMADIKVGMSQQEIEALIERRLDQKLAEKALNEKVMPAPGLSDDVQRRLNALEERVSKKEDSEGLQYLLMAKQHQARGEHGSALKMYQLAQPFFPGNEKLNRKIQSIQDKLHEKSDSKISVDSSQMGAAYTTYEGQDDEDYEGAGATDEDSFHVKPTNKRKPKSKIKAAIYHDGPPTPRTNELLRIINSRDSTQIKLLKGVGAKKAEAIVSSLFDMDASDDSNLITDLEQLGALKGVGWKTVENMRVGLGLSII
jgi:DNA uptake protein ComE-like DNA-binding protein